MEMRLISHPSQNKIYNSHPQIIGTEGSIPASNLWGAGSILGLEAAKISCTLKHSKLR
jgi:hypothetical protein